MALPKHRLRDEASVAMGKIGFGIILAAVAAYAADHYWNHGHYTQNTVAVLRSAQHALGL
jgi:hypothetical protein